MMKQSMKHLILQKVGGFEEGSIDDSDFLRIEDKYKIYKESLGKISLCVKDLRLSLNTIDSVSLKIPQCLYDSLRLTTPVDEREDRFGNAQDQFAKIFSTSLAFDERKRLEKSVELPLRNLQDDVRVLDEMLSLRASRRNDYTYYKGKYEKLSRQKEDSLKAGKVLSHSSTEKLERNSEKLQKCKTSFYQVCGVLEGKMDAFFSRWNTTTGPLAKEVVDIQKNLFSYSLERYTKLSKVFAHIGPARTAARKTPSQGLRASPGAAAVPPPPHRGGVEAKVISKSPAVGSKFSRPPPLRFNEDDSSRPSLLVPPPNTSAAGAASSPGKIYSATPTAVSQRSSAFHSPPQSRTKTPPPPRLRQYTPPPSKAVGVKHFSPLPPPKRSNKGVIKSKNALTGSSYHHRRNHPVVDRDSKRSTSKPNPDSRPASPIASSSSTGRTGGGGGGGDVGSNNTARNSNVRIRSIQRQTRREDESEIVRRRQMTRDVRDVGADIIKAPRQQHIIAPARDNNDNNNNSNNKMKKNNKGIIRDRTFTRDIVTTSSNDSSHHHRVDQRNKMTKPKGVKTTLNVANRMSKLWTNSIPAPPIRTSNVKTKAPGKGDRKGQQSIPSVAVTGAPPSRIASSKWSSSPSSSKQVPQRHETKAAGSSPSPVIPGSSSSNTNSQNNNYSAVVPPPPPKRDPNFLFSITESAEQHMKIRQSRPVPPPFTGIQPRTATLYQVGKGSNKGKLQKTDPPPPKYTGLPSWQKAEEAKRRGGANNTVPPPVPSGKLSITSPPGPARFNASVLHNKGKNGSNIGPPFRSLVSSSSQPPPPPPPPPRVSRERSSSGSTK